MLTKLMVLISMWWMNACAATVPANAPPNPPDAPHADQTLPVAEPKQEIVVPQDMPDGVPTPQIPAAINDLLDRLETNAADLLSFTADVEYEKEDPLLGRKELRIGDLIYKLDSDTKEKSFAILFDAVIIQGVKRGEGKHFVFNGRWLAEIDHANKQFIKREIVAPGKQLDPLKLGEGPFPLPIGQPKAEVLSRFDVTTATIPETGLLKGLKNVDGISLVPKPGAREADDYTLIELFYDKATTLPAGMNLVEKNGDRKTVRLLNVNRNPTLNEAQLKRLDINEPDPKKWKVDVRPWGG